MADDEGPGRILGTGKNVLGRASAGARDATVKTPAGNAPVLPLLLMGIGLYLMWFAVHYFRDTNVVWPSDPIKQALQGQGAPKPTRQPTVSAQLSAAISTAQAEAPGPANSPGGEPSLPSSGHYSESQLQTIWKLAGGNPAQAAFAAGVALSESSGDPKAESANPDGGKNVGLWQLDTKGEGAGHTVEQLKNPATNAKITVAKTNNGTDWSSWSDSWVAVHGTGGANTAANKAAGNPGGTGP